MPESTGVVNGGLGAPAARRRERKSSEGAGVIDGDQKPERGTAEPQRGTESAIGEPFKLIDPLDIPTDTGAGSGSQPRRRGRPAGSRNKKEDAVSNLSSLLKIERLLTTGCFFLGNIASCPELYISEEESKEISEALKELAKFYPIGMSEKAIAWVNFSFAVGGVFGPKAIAIYQRPPKPRVQRMERTEAGPSHPVYGGASTNGIPEPPMATPETAKVPSEMWPQSGDLDNDE